MKKILILGATLMMNCAPDLSDLKVRCDCDTGEDLFTLSCQCLITASDLRRNIACECRPEGDHLVCECE